MNKSPYEPELIEVVTREGSPKAVKYRGRFAEVKEILNMWRIDEEWWKKEISRLYYSLELPSGARLTVFHDLIEDRWYRQAWV
jgi:hypothetical protein